MNPEPLNKLHDLVLAWAEHPDDPAAQNALSSYLQAPSAVTDLNELVERLGQSLAEKNLDLSLQLTGVLLRLGEAFGMDPLLKAGLHLTLASLLLEMERLPEAEIVAREGVRLQSENKGRPLELAGALGCLRTILRAAGKYVEATELTLNEISYLMDHQAPPLTVAESWVLLGSILMDAGRYAEAEEAAREGLRLQKENQAPPIAVAESRAVLGTILMHAGRYTEAEQAAREGLQLQRENQAPPLTVAQSWGVLGSILMEAGRCAEAEHAAREGLRLEEENQAPPLTVADSLAGLGSILMHAGRYAEAEQAAREGLRLRKENQAPPMTVANSLAGLGSILMLAGRYAEAEEAVLTGLTLQLKGGANPLVLASSYATLGSILMHVGRYAEAEQAVKKGLDLELKHQAPHLKVALTFGALSSILLLTGRYLEAEEAVTNGLKLQLENQAPPLTVAQSWGALGSILMRAGRYAEAEQAAREGLRLKLENQAPPLTVAGSWGALGSILMGATKYAQAERVLEHASWMAEQYQGLGELPINAAYQRAAIAEDLDKRANLCSDAILRLMDYCLSLNSPEDHFRAVRQYGYVFRDAIAWAMEAGREDLALEWFDRSRGLAFTLALARQTAERDTLDRLRQLQDLQRQAEASLAQSPGDPGALQQLEALASEQRELIAGERDRVAKTVEAPLKRADRSALIPAGTLYLALEPLGDQVLVYALTTDQELLESRPIKVEIVAEGPLAGDLNLLVEMRLRGERGFPNNLRDRLLSDGVQALASAAQEVILSPGGGLGQLPFEAMEVQGRRLDEDRVVSRGSTVGVLQFIRRKPATGDSPDVLAIGMNDGTHPEAPYPEPPDDAPPAMNDPSREGDPAVRASADPNIVPRLRYAEKEARDVVKTYKRGTSLTGPQALASRVKELLGSACVFSASLHGFSNHGDPLRSGLMLQPFGEAEGALTALDFLGVKGSSTELALLSACGSSGTDLFTGGEGVVGLPTGLIYTGVRTVIATIRPVKDGLAYCMVLAIHRHLRQGLTAHEALRAVRRLALAGEFGPLGKRLWESHVFVVYGDPHMRLPEALLDHS